VSFFRNPVDDRQLDMVWFSKLLLVLVAGIIVLATGLCSGLEQLVYTFSNQVGAGNFSYFKLHRDGTVRLELKSISGDADLYVSSFTLSPDYVKYELSSATCGVDEVIVTAEMLRPVGVGVFGHPSHEISHFVLSVYFLQDDASSDPVTLNGDTSQRISTSGQDQPDSEQQESILWTIFVGLLKIILDIMV